MLVTAALCSGWGRGSEVESNLPNDTQQGSSRAGRSALFFLYRILWLTYQAVPEEGDTVPGVREGQSLLTLSGLLSWAWVCTSQEST